MKRIVVSEECCACGNCTLMTELLKENSNGTASPIEPGLLQDKDIEEFNPVIACCPTKAISLQDLNELHGSKDNLETIKNRFIEKLKNFKFDFPAREDFRFDKTLFTPPAPAGNVISRYSYTSGREAERAGLQEFNKSMYSQKQALIQAILVQYKNMKLQQYYCYEEKETNFYYNINRKIQNMLKEIKMQIDEASSGKINLPNDFTVFNVIPDFKSTPGSIYQLQHLKEIYITNNIANELERLDWYDTYIDTEEKELSSRSVYRFDFSDAARTFGGHILDECQYVINDRVPEIVKAQIEPFAKKITEEVSKKVDILIKGL